MIIRFVSIFLPITVIIIITATFFYDYEKKNSTKLISLQERALINTGRQLLYDQLDPVIHDLYYLENYTQYLNQTSDPDRNSHVMDDLRMSYYSFSESHLQYDQIRFIDINGKELVRVNNTEGTTTLIPDEQLQDKSQRYYVVDMLNHLYTDQTYISPLDLNIEQGNLEQPLKPMIRLGRAVFGTNGQRIGFVLINYKAQLMLDRLHTWAEDQLCTMMLVNRDGYWLHGKTVEKEWGFMFPDRENVRFQAENQNLWESNISRQESGQEIGKNGLLTFTTIYPLPDSAVSSSGSGSPTGKSRQLLRGKEYYWKLISQVSPELIQSANLKIRNNIVLFSLAITAIAAVFSGYLARAQIRRRTADNALKATNESLEETVKNRTEALYRRNIQLSEEIEARKNTETALSESEQRYRAIMNSMEDAVYITSQDYRLMYVNPAVIDRLGRDCTGEKCYSVLYDNSSPCPWCVLDKVVKGEHTYYELETSDNGKVYHISNSPIYLEQGIPSKLTISRDITDHKQTQQALRKSKLEYSMLLETMREGLLVLNKDGMVVHCNRQFAQLLELSTQDIIDRHATELVDQENREILRRELDKRKNNIVTPYEISWLKSDGKNCLTSVSPAIWINELGERMGSFALITDITSQREAEKTRRSLEEQLQQAQKMEALGTLAGGIAHDFNNILAAIMGYAELATCSIEQGSQAASDIDHILSAGQRATQLVQQILAFSRQTDLDKQPMEIIPIIKEALKFIEAATSSSVTIGFKVKDDIGKISANPSQIHQIIMNLATNACQAMEKQGGKLEVITEKIVIDELSTPNLQIKKGEALLLTVRDTGPGISPENLEKIFNPFFTTKEIGKGTGLGLAVVQSIIKDLEGQIEVESSLNKGTTFRIYLPISQTVDQESPVISEQIPLGNGENVIWVDDEIPLVSMGCRILDSLGYKSIGCHTPEQCLEKMEHNRSHVQLIISDYNMPGMNGLELFNTIRKTNKDVRFILCSGISEEIITEDVRELGIDLFLMKPVRKYDIAHAAFNTLNPAQ